MSTSGLVSETRINSKLLRQYVGQTVRVPLKIIQINGDMAMMQSSDGGQIGVHLGRDMHIDSAYVEIIGRVEEDLSVRALTSLSLGNNLVEDMKAVQSVIEFAQSSKGQGVLA